MKSLALCTCEKVIIDKAGAHSLINLILNAELQLAQGIEEVPRNAVNPYQWFIYSAWVPSSEDVGEHFEQVFQIYWPDGQKFFENKLGFTQPDESVQQVSFGIVGFPIGQTGRMKILTWLEKKRSRVTEVGEANIVIKHIPQTADTTAAATTER